MKIAGKIKKQIIFFNDIDYQFNLFAGNVWRSIDENSKTDYFLN